MPRSKRTTDRFFIKPASGEWFGPALWSGATTSATPAQNIIRAIPLYVPEPIYVSSVGLTLTGATGTAGSTLTCGIYFGDSTSPIGSPLIVGSAVAADTSGVVTRECALASSTLVFGQIWLAYYHNAAAAPTISVCNGGGQNCPHTAPFTSGGTNAPIHSIQMNSTYSAGTMPVWSGTTRSTILQAPMLMLKAT